MAFFKLHKGANKSRSAASALGSVENLRRRARHRLIGAAVLVSVGVTGFPKLFDSEPRSLPVNVPITIIHPKNTSVSTLATIPSSPMTSMIVESEAGTRQIIPQSPAQQPPVQQLVPKYASPSNRPILSLPPPKNAAATRTATAAAVTNKDKDKAKSKSKSKSKSEPEPEDRPAKPFIVQVGNFSDFSKAHAVRVKVESSGLKTYTQIIERKNEKRVLVRIGPMKSRNEADAAAARIRKLNLSASVLER